MHCKSSNLKIPSMVNPKRKLKVAKIRRRNKRRTRAVLTTHLRKRKTRRMQLLQTQIPLRMQLKLSKLLS